MSSRKKHLSKTHDLSEGTQADSKEHKDASQGSTEQSPLARASTRLRSSIVNAIDESPLFVSYHTNKTDEDATTAHMTESETPVVKKMAKAAFEEKVGIFVSRSKDDVSETYQQLRSEIEKN